MPEKVESQTIAAESPKQVAFATPKVLVNALAVSAELPSDEEHRKALLAIEQDCAENNCKQQ